MFEPDADTYVASGLDYFAHADTSQGWPSTYIGDLDRPVEQQSHKFNQVWPVSAVFQSLRRAGLAIDHFGEHRDEYWDSYPNLRPELRGRVPMTFSMIARRP